MTDNTSPQIPNPQDELHLKIIAICHFVFLVVLFIGIGFLLLHYFLMSSMMNNAQMNVNNRPPAEFMVIMNVMYIIFGFLIAIGVICNFLSAIFIIKRINRIFSIIVACINCFQVPFGTALGVFTLIVLFRDSVKNTYAMPNQSLKGRM